ncbi:MAG: peptidylprolyl isomerase [Bacteroidetes bacterium]|nr:peptidylprolyl isomerase [Bacteroidota bacterium]
MAILNSIRKKGVFLIIIIALALFAFVLDGVIGSSTSSPKGQSNIATVNGIDIPREDFMKLVDVTQRSLGPSTATTQAMNIVWERELRRVLLNEQYEALGLTIEKAQLSDALSTNLANNPTFQNDAGQFDERKLQEYIANLKATSLEAYQQWLDFEKITENGILEKNYFNLVKGGFITTLAEGKQEYHFQNDKINIEYVHLPYSKIADEDVPVSSEEIEKYIKDHPKDFEVEPLLDIQYISFTEDPSPEDIDASRETIAALLQDKIEFNNVSDMNDTIPGFFKTTDYQEFVNANSDKGYIDRWWFKKDLPSGVADTISNLNVGEIYGPYREGNNFNLIKVIEERQMPDSVKANHILIRFQGLVTAPQDVSRTKEEAKALADSILNVLQKDKSKYEVIAADFSEDLSNKDSGGDLGYFVPGNMVTVFNDFVFDNEIGKLGVVETNFGFHIIEIVDQKNIQKVLKVATITKEIEPSEKTMNEVFSNAANFELDSQNGDFNELAKEQGLNLKPVNRIGKLDANIPGIGNNRQIVNWAYQDDTNIGDVRRFNVLNGYVIAQLTRKNPKGLMSISEASSIVTPILRNEKKAVKIRESVSGTTLNEIASNQNVTVQNATALTMANPTIAGAGTEAKVIGMAFGKKVGESTDLIDGKNGVYIVRILAINNAPDLEDYSFYANQLNATLIPTINFKVYNALKNAAKIEDNRADFY